MKRFAKTVLFLFLIFVVMHSIMQPAIAQQQPIVLDFYYSSNCGSCEVQRKLINESFAQNASYQDVLVVVWKDIAKNTTYLNEWKTEYKNYSYPFVVVRYQTDEVVLPKYEIKVETIARIIDAYVANMTVNMTTGEDMVIETIFGDIRINVSAWSLPILTIVLGGLDSLNPCAFFILIFLLNLLIYARSRKRMMLVGGVFILFSGLFYFVFMFLLFNAFFLTREHVGIITLIAGGLALVLGIINIKDFFWFKKGASLSIPEEKKPGLFKQMRELVKTPQLPLAIMGTVVLATTVNFYELLCTLGLPLVFTQQLALYDLAPLDYYLYIFLYNVVYVIPLIVIVLIFVITLGRRKLSEWHGQVLKLMTGIMLSSFGVLFLVDYRILEIVITPIVLLLFSAVATAVIALVWKSVQAKKEGE